MSSKYSLGEVLGQGKFSTVYKGYKKEKPEEVLAIKVLDLEKLVSPPPVGHGPIYKKYWHREIEVMKALRGHPNIVCLDDIDNPEDKIAYIAMEYCDKDLKTFLLDPGHKDKQRTLSEKDAQTCMRQLANAFKFMCGVAIAHRDLKPQNILVTTFGDGTFALKISDFGFARKMEKETNMLASMLGTPLYMAPEIRSKTYSDTCDLWSLGVILYELLFGFNGLSTKVEEFKKGRISNIIEKANLSSDCKSMLAALLQPDPSKRISMLEFFSHPFIIEPHPEVSLLSDHQLSQLENANTIQVFIFPTFQNYTLAFDDKLAVWEWKKTVGLREEDLLVLCRDTTTNDSSSQERWSGVELRDMEILESYQIGELGTTNKCLFIFRKNATMNPNDILAELPPDPEKVPDNLPLDEFFVQCKEFVTKLNNNVCLAYDICSRFVLVRDLMLHALRALFTVIKSKKGDLEGDLQKAQHVFEPFSKKWDGLRAEFTQTCSVIDQIPSIALPEFLRPKPASLTDLIIAKKKELDQELALLKQIDDSFAKAKQQLNTQVVHNITLDEKLKPLLNRDVYECKKNSEHFKNNFEKASSLPSEKCEGEEKETWFKLLNFSEVLTQKVRTFYVLCKNDVKNTMALADLINVALVQHAHLSKMSDPTCTDVFTIPNIERAINTFSNSLQSIVDFNALPALVQRVVHLLQERQTYELMMNKLIPRTGRMFEHVFSRYNNIDQLYNKNKQQIELIFPKFSQLSALPRAAIALDPPPALSEYQKISANFLFPGSPLPDVQDLDDQFSFILSDNINVSDLLRDSGILADKLRTANAQLDDMRAKLTDAEARTGLGGGDLARRVALYERMATLKTEAETQRSKDDERITAEKHKADEERITAEKIKAAKLLQEMENYKEEMHAQVRGAETLMREVDALREQVRDVSSLQAQLTQEKEARRSAEQRCKTMETQVGELKAQTQESSNAQKASEYAMAQELEKLRAQVEFLRMQVSETATLREHLAKESEARVETEESNKALTARLVYLQDTVMAYEISYGVDAQLQPPPAPPT